MDANTLDVERLAGQNVHGFNPTKVFVEIFLRCLGQKCLLFGIIKVRCLHSLENFHGTVDNCEKYEGLV